MGLEPINTPYKTCNKVQIASKSKQDQTKNLQNFPRWYRNEILDPNDIARKSRFQSYQSVDPALSV